MTRKVFGALALALVLVLGLFAARMVTAQTSGGTGGMMGMTSMMKDCPMMGAVAQGPRAALEHRKELGLSDAQVKRLEALAGQAKPDHARMMRQMQALHQEIRQATSGEQFNEAAVRAAYGSMGEMGVSLARARHGVRQILTPAQRQKLEEQGSGMMGMHGMMHGGMMGGMDMENCPMMKGIR